MSPTVPPISTMTMSFLSETALEGAFDLVGHVGDDLDGLAQVLALALLPDDGLVNAAGRPVVRPGRPRRRKSFIMAKIQVGLGPVVRHIDLAVLERAHRSRIHVEIGIELLNRDLVAVAFQEHADGSGRDPLAQSRNDAARHEDVLSHVLSP